MYEFMEDKQHYQSPSLEIIQMATDVVTASDDPAVDDGYGSDGLNWGA